MLNALLAVVSFAVAGFLFYQYTNSGDNKLYIVGSIVFALVGLGLGALFLSSRVNKTEDIQLLMNSVTMPTILPGAAFFLSLPNPPARQMIDAGLPLAIASDFNPGSSPSGNMNLMQSIACVQYKLTPNETINASTINTAYAMKVEEELGSITVGKKANLFITKQIPSVDFLQYSFGSNLIDTVILNGKVCHQANG